MKINDPHIHDTCAYVASGDVSFFRKVRFQEDIIIIMFMTHDCIFMSLPSQAALGEFVIFDSGETKFSSQWFLTTINLFGSGDLI